MTISETIIQGIRRFSQVVRAFFDRLAEVLRPAFRKIAETGKKIQRHRVRGMRFSPDPQVSTAACIWLRTKNRRIKRKQLRLLFPKEGW